MRTLAHISDLHFGRTEPSVVEGLLTELAREAPHLVVVSGDLTQRAREAQFAEARAFLDRLPAPWLAVPGNHDVPLYDVLRRFLSPLERYRRHISPVLDPLHVDDELAVIGLNTARSLTFKDGRLSHAQLEHLERVLAGLPAGCRKVVVTHHQLVVPPGAHDQEVVRHAEAALELLDRGGVELLLAGHLHASSTQDVRAVHPGRRSMLIVQCGTSTSTRVRDEPNSYNLIRLEPGAISVSVRAWQDGGFSERHAGRWPAASGG